MKFKLVPIKEIKKKKYTGYLHDLTVKDNHSYNINGIIVHNSVCETRNRIGFGIPTLTSIMDCAKTKSENSYLIADGGIEYPGDIAKAIAAGADMAMMGKMFAGTSLSSGIKYDKNFEITEKEEEFKWVEYRGMASKEARQNANMKDGSVEGVSGLIPYNGETKEFFNQILKNLKIAISYYGGCRNWEEFKRNIKFIGITQSGWVESDIRVKII